MFKRRICALVAMLLLVLSVTGCSQNAMDYNGYLKTGEYNKEVFYQNEGIVQAADPSVITVGDTYYMYATNADWDGNTSYLKAWKSKNLTVWECLGPVFKPQRDSWAVTSLWAPEVIEKDGTYYMYYSGMNAQTGVMGIGVAVADNPEGPFHEVEGTIDGKTYSHTVMPIDVGFPAIDANPFIDDDGSVYLYVSKDQVDKMSSIYVCKLKPNMVELETVYENCLVKPSQNWENPDSTNTWNEAPHMVKRNGEYILFYSANYYESSLYAIGAATSDNPVSGFVKLEENPVLEAFPDWGYVSGTGHCSVFSSADGKELFMAYHCHIDVHNGGSERKLCFDRLTFDDDNIPVVSGPSITPQLLPSGSSKYYNLAGNATVTAPGYTALLTDGIVNYKESTADKYEYTVQKDGKITFTFDKAYTIRGIMIYDSCTYAASADSAKVTIGDQVISALKFNPDYKYVDEFDFEVKQPGSCAIAEFNEVTATTVTIELKEGVAISEIVIIGY